MRGMRGCVALVVVALVAGAAGPLGAAGKTQQCDGPAPAIQSGRATITPGLNALSLPQHLAVKISLFSCSPNRATRGEGTVQSTITFKTRQTCALLTHPRTLDMTATITWKDMLTSTLTLTLVLSGKSQNVTASGKVTHGLFKNHPVSGHFHYKDVVSPSALSRHGPGIAQACANRTAPKRYGHASISGLTFYTTKPFVIA
jgi:hypothetical protein